MRSENSAFFFLVPLSILVIGCLFFFAHFAAAKDMQADMQCQAGGVVNQACQDTTNGYVTKGHCTHINVCKADSWPKSPKGCGTSGNIYSPTGDCPKGPQYGQGTPTRVTPIATSSESVSDPNSSTISTDIFDQAFSSVDEMPSQQQSTLSTTTLDGIEYLISDGEALVVGAPLTEVAPEPDTAPRRTLALGTVAGLAPKGPSESLGEDRTYANSYVPAVGFFSSAGSQQYVQQANFASRVVSLGTDAVHSFSDGIVHALMSASGLNFDTSGEVVVIGPYKSMYDQAQHEDLAPFIEQPWTKVSQTPLSYMIVERMSNVNRLLHGALTDAGAASYDLFTADLTKSSEKFSSALHKTSDAIGLLGKLAASIALKAITRD